MIFTQKLTAQSGSTLVEVLVAIGLAGIMLPALAAAIITSTHARPTATQQLLANGLLQEMTSATRSIRESGWANVATNGTYHPIISGNGWALANGSVTTNGFTEQIVISSVERDSSLAIVPSGGTVDPSTKLITASVSWSKPTSSSVSEDSYLTRWQNQAVWTQTTVADFTGDTLSGTEITDSGDGEVQLISPNLSGTLVSSAFNAGTSNALDYLTFTASQPAGTSIEFQIATSATNGGFSYVGPDGTSSTYFTASSTIPLAIPAGQYFSYRAIFTTSSAGITPVLDSASLTYSP